MARLSDVAEVQAGYYARRSIDSNPHGSHLLIQGRDIQLGRPVDPDALMSFDPDGDPKRYEVRLGDILFQSRGVSHLAYLVNQDLPPAIASGSFYILRPDTRKIHPGFLAWWINQDRAQSILAGLSSGTKMPLVQICAIRELDIPDLDLATQEKIANTVQLLHHVEDLEEQLRERRSSLVTNTCINAIERETLQ